MSIKSFIILTAAGIELAACQSNLFKISGQTKGLADGDSLFLTYDMQNGIPSDTIVVSDNEFSFKGECDEVRFAMIYNAKRNDINVPFFVEPGDIRITLSDTPGMSRVEGTNCNDQWQVLNDSVMAIGLRINKIAEHIYGQTVSKEEQQKGMAQIDLLTSHFNQVVVEKAEKNVDNEFGYFLLTYYPEDVISNDQRLELFKKMPDALRQRPAVKQWEESIARQAKSAEGAIISDFTQQTPQGQPISLMSEIVKNKLTIIDFWASWCMPCRQEMPFMIELYEKYKEQGLGIIGISLDKDAIQWQAAISKLKIPWPQMSDLKGWENEAAREMSVSAIPHVIVVNQKGRIVSRGLRGEELEKFIASQLVK